MLRGSVISKSRLNVTDKCGPHRLMTFLVVVVVFLGLRGSSLKQRLHNT